MINRRDAEIAEYFFFQITSVFSGLGGE